MSAAGARAYRSSDPPSMSAAAALACSTLSPKRGPPSAQSVSLFLLPNAETRDASFGRPSLSAQSVSVSAQRWLLHVRRYLTCARGSFFGLETIASSGHPAQCLAFFAAMRQGHSFVGLEAIASGDHPCELKVSRSLCKHAPGAVSWTRDDNFERPPRSVSRAPRHHARGAFIRGARDDSFGRPSL